jgi:ribosomal protein L40E
VPSSKVICPHCDYADSPPDAVNCESCGYALRAPEAVRTGRRGVAKVVGTLLIVVFGFYLLARAIAANSDTPRRSYLGSRDYLDFGPRNFTLAPGAVKAFSWRNEVKTPLCRVYGEVTGPPGTVLMVLDSVNHDRLLAGGPAQPIESWEIAGQQSFRAQPVEPGQNHFVAVKHEGAGPDSIRVQFLSLSVTCFERWL